MNNWSSERICDVCELIPVGKKYSKELVCDHGKTKVLDQSQADIFGWHDNSADINASSESPVFTFANHTCSMRWMEEPFSVIQNVFPITGIPGKTDTRFLYYASGASVLQDGYKGHFPLFRETIIQVPPLPEQKKIAVILSGIDKLISEHNNYCDKLTNLLRAAIFVEFSRYDDNERRRVSLLQLAKEVKRGPSLSTNNERKGVRYVTSGSICEGKVRLDLDEKFLDGYDGIDSCVIKENDLLLNCVNSAARVGASAVFIGKDYCITGFNNFAITLRPDLCDPRYIYYWTTSSDFRSQVRTIIKDAINQVSFSKKDLGEFFLPIPDLEHQQRIAEKWIL